MGNWIKKWKEKLSVFSYETNLPLDICRERLTNRYLDRLDREKAESIFGNKYYSWIFSLKEGRDTRSEFR